MLLRNSKLRSNSIQPLKTKGAILKKFSEALAASLALVFLSSQGFAQPVLTDDQRVLVCRATAAAMGYHPLDIVQGDMLSEGLASATYNRPSNNTRWTTHCKFDGDRVIWANVENGKRMRWRDNHLDEKILWRIDGRKVTVIQVWGDGSRSTDSYDF